jgi:hypothetical protein
MGGGGEIDEPHQVPEGVRKAVLPGGRSFTDVVKPG